MDKWQALREKEEKEKQRRILFQQLQVYKIELRKVQDNPQN